MTQLASDSRRMLRVKLKAREGLLRGMVARSDVKTAPDTMNTINTMLENDTLSILPRPGVSQPASTASGLHRARFESEAT